MAAAVADFRPADAAPNASSSAATALTLELEPTPDLLAEVARIARGLDSDGAATRGPLEPRPVLVGFAAETGSLERAAEKLRRKGVDLLVANDVAEPGSGLRHRHQPGHDPRRRRLARGPAAAVEARRSPTAPRPGGARAGRPRRRRADWSAIEPVREPTDERHRPTPPAA